MNEPKPLPNPSETRLVETPRTDEVVRIAEELGSGFPATQADYNALAEHARQLERELIERNEILAEAREEVSSMESAWRNDNRLNATALASLADELRQTELKGCYRLIDELKEDLRQAREEQIALLRFIQKEHPVTREMWNALFPKKPSST